MGEIIAYLVAAIMLLLVIVIWKMIRLLILAIWKMIKLLIWLGKLLTQALCHVIQGFAAVIDRKLREREHQKQEALKPHKISMTAQNIRAQMANSTNQFLSETELFLKGE